MTMLANLRVLIDKSEHEFAPGLTTFVSSGTTTERSFRGRFVTTPPRRQKNDRRQQVVGTKRRNQTRGRHFRQTQFHDLSAGILACGTPVSCRLINNLKTKKRAG
jgi:hypothetical protein